MTKTSLTLSKMLVLAATASFLALPSALATGEPKNVTPFTDPIAGRGLAAANRVESGSSLLIVGEAKTQVPFTIVRLPRGAGTKIPVNVLGEAKKLPFAGL